MARFNINIGTNADDGTGDNLRDAFDKVNRNFVEVYQELGGNDLSNIRMSGTTLTTDTSNSNIILNPNGSGKIVLDSPVVATDSVLMYSSLEVDGATQLDGVTTINNNLTVTGTTTLSSVSIGAIAGTSATYSGNVTVQGLLDAQGSVDLGDSTVDTITFTGRVDSSIVPSLGSTYNLGSSSLRWGDLYAVNADFSGNVTIGGNITIGDSTTDSISISAELENDLIPDLDSTYNVGSTGKRYANVWADTHTGDTGSFGNISTSGNSITSTDANGNINLTPNGAGEVVASSLSVSDLTDNRIVIAGASGALEGDANLTYDGTTLTTTALSIDNIGIDGNTISSTSGDIILSAAGNISAATKQIKQLADPVDLTDAVNIQYLNTRLALSLAADDSSIQELVVGNETLQIKGAGIASTSLSGDVLTITATETDTLDSILTRNNQTTIRPRFNNGVSVSNSNLTIDGNLTLRQNNISTITSNSNIVLDPNGTGETEIRGDATVSGTLTATTLTATNLAGTLNTAAQPNITSVGTLPTLDVGTLRIVDNNITTYTTNSDIVLSPAGVGTVNVATSRITNVFNPSGPQDAATKSYVDTTVAAYSMPTYTVANLPVGSAGNLALATDGRKNGEGVGAGTGVMVFHDGTNWIASDSGQTVAA